MSTSSNTPRGASSSNVIAFPWPVAEVSSAQGKRKKRAPYKDRARTAWHTDGLPIIDPAGEDDEIFRHIHEHRAAIDHYDRCVTLENEAEGTVSASEYAFLQHKTRNVYEELMLHARCVILCRPTTRRGLIHQTRYLAAQFSMSAGTKRPSSSCVCRRRLMIVRCLRRSCTASRPDCGRWPVSSSLRAREQRNEQRDRISRR
jgi:hypothetical protein